MDDSFDQDELLDSIGENVPLDDLEVTKKENQIYEELNKGSKSQHRHTVFICSLYLFWGIGIIIILVRVYHFIASDCYQWLSLEQIQSLDKLLFSGTVGTVIGRYGNNLFK
ncbi:hypothetical protein [Zobellia galactanivorans]|uniref:Hypothetical membrane protein n=1 Tax=Zobellia galactanivorans (strain DSM 12802 / CCUG 47099 / CIP 106680 / NCIMB 13871 / Dsij) TaxID=63186 RepID=G0L6X5_ZOBGA|nr:hypothetical protein [Zobellia galactanivorans]CAZ98720.1 Hypothetical membrane protein [Zobellia galactanivorans]